MPRRDLVESCQLEIAALQELKHQRKLRFVDCNEMTARNFGEALKTNLSQQKTLASEKSRSALAWPLKLGSEVPAPVITLTRFRCLPWNLRVNIIGKESYPLIVGRVQPEHPVKNTGGFLEAA